MTENTIKCPKCGEIIKVDESLYVSIVKQIRDKEFTKELNAQLKAADKEKASAVELAEAKTAKNYTEQLNEKDLKIQELQNQIKSMQQEKDSEVKALKVDIEKIHKEQELAVTKAVAERDNKITALEAQVESTKNGQELAVKNAVAEREKEIIELKGQIATNKEIAKNAEKTLKSRYEAQLKDRDDEIQRIKDMKLQMSTKMVGETLEQHCEIEFNNLRATGFQGAYFDKDNDDKGGSKGDYIFRDYDEEKNEYISIMFEMKNEMDDTEKKHKNEDFFKKLDKDRKEKKCEYAVLVSMLEQDNDYYNNGIVDVSHKYEKMYVIRPQFFIPMITLLRNAAKNSLAYRKQMQILQQQNIDVTNFEQQMNDFKEKFGRNYKLAGDHFQEAIKQIDNSIAALEKTKKELIGSEKNLRLANDRAQDLSIKKLTKDSPTLRAQFEEVKEEK